VLAGDAPYVTLHMEFEWQFRHLFALQGRGRHYEALLCPKCGGEWKKIHAVPNTRSVPRASGFVLVAKGLVIVEGSPCRALCRVPAITGQSWCPRLRGQFGEQAGTAEHGWPPGRKECATRLGSKHKRRCVPYVCSSLAGNFERTVESTNRCVFHSRLLSRVQSDYHDYIDCYRKEVTPWEWVRGQSPKPRRNSAKSLTRRDPWGRKPLRGTDARPRW